MHTTKHYLSEVHADGKKVTLTLEEKQTIRERLVLFVNQPAVTVTTETGEKKADETATK